MIAEAGITVMSGHHLSREKYLGKNEGVSSAEPLLVLVALLKIFTTCPTEMRVMRIVNLKR